MDNRVVGYAVRAHTLDTTIKDSLTRMRAEWVRMAEALYEFRDIHGWKALGCETMEEWLAGPEIGLSRRYVFQLIDAYRTLVIDHQVPAAQLEDYEVTKIREVLPAIRREEVTVAEALADVRALARSDLERRYRSGEHRDGGTQLDAGREPVWETCQACGSRYLAK